MNIKKEEEICTKISDNVKMAGFLEKKGKMKLVSPWKKYWFVLEDKLLLYYRSQIEYINLSPCRGSLNMGLVSTVRPGSSNGPCIIHVITRTQVVQLRAKNRATQEEWLQALLDSMSLNLAPKTTPTVKSPLTFTIHSLRYSMDNIPSSGERKVGGDGQTTLPHRKTQMNAMNYGGSLDAALWSKKCRPLRSPSPNIPKGKMLEKILGYVQEVEASSTPDISSFRNDGHETKQNESLSDSDQNETKCKIHDENRNRDFYSSVDKSKKKITRALSDNQLASEPQVKNFKSKIKEESRFEKIKSVITRKPKEKAGKTKSDPETSKPNAIKRRRQSFLYKVFKKHHKKKEGEPENEESDLDDPLYDTIDNVNVTEQKKDDEEESTKTTTTADVSATEGENKKLEQPLYTEIQKPLFGSKSILTAQAMSELRSKLKSRESLEGDRETAAPAPALPPRRGSRPRSPLQDAQFESNSSDSNLQSEMPPPKEDEKEQKPDSLSVLLEQLADIASAPLSTKQMSGCTSLEPSSSTSDNKSERRHSDPDYDIPRPHRPLDASASVHHDNDDGDKISATQFLGKSDSTSSSFQSIEPDSLETGGNKSQAN